MLSNNYCTLLKVDYMFEGELDRGRKKARFPVAYLIAYRSLVNQLYATKYFYFTPFSSTAQLEFVGNPEFCH